MAPLPDGGCPRRAVRHPLRAIAVLRLDFADAGAGLIARENTAIFEAVLDGDGDEAARLWRVKVERSTRYMANLLPQDHVDPDLWATIAGRPTPRTVKGPPDPGTRSSRR